MFSKGFGEIPAKVVLKNYLTKWKIYAAIKSLTTNKKCRSDELMVIKLTITNLSSVVTSL